MSNSSSTAKDLTAGTVGGIAQVLVGQPFDIVKVVRSNLSTYPALALVVTRSFVLSSSSFFRLLRSFVPSSFLLRSFPPSLMSPI